jgi:excisionase family DNA binding protein
LATDLSTSVPPIPSLETFPNYGRVREVAEFTGLSESSIWRAIWSNDLASTRISGRTVRVSREQLRAWLEKKTAGRGQAV